MSLGSTLAAFEQGPQNFAVNANGEILVTAFVPSSSRESLIAERFSATGQLLYRSGSLYDLNSDPPPQAVETVALADGTFAIAFTRPGGPSQAPFIVVALGGDRTATGFFSATRPSIAALGAGGYVIQWEGTDGLTHTQSMAADGLTRVGPERAGASHVYSTLAGVGASGYVETDDQTLTYFDGASARAPLALPGAPQTSITLTDGRVALAWVALHSVWTQVYDPQSNSLLGAARQLPADYASGTPHLATTADGGYVISWQFGDPNGRAEAVTIGADGAVGGLAYLAGDVVGRFGDTLVTVRTTGSGGIVAQDYHIAAPPAPPANPAPEQLEPASGAVSLTASSGWTGAAVLSNHALAVVGLHGSAAFETTYTSAGTQVWATSLYGSTGSRGAQPPQVGAYEVGGFYSVSYAGGSDLEVYNVNDQRVFIQNQYTGQTGAFAPLANGGYVITDRASNAFGLFDSSANNVGWLQLPDGAPSTPDVHALQGGGFVFTYAGSARLDAFDSAGHLLTTGSLGAPLLNYAAAFTATPDGGFAEAWLSSQGAHGDTTAITLRTFDAAGRATSAAVTVGQDADPWHTSFALQAHQDGSLALIWSEGGGIFGAEVANGAASAPQAAMAGDLASVRLVELSDGDAGFAYLHGGDVWAELFDPATGRVVRADLGAASGDLSTVHALATANGGLAVSWHLGDAVLAAVLNDGGASAPLGISGDLLGVDSQGRALAVQDQGGTPVLQAYVLDDGLFWLG